MLCQKRFFRHGECTNAFTYYFRPNSRDSQSISIPLELELDPIQDYRISAGPTLFDTQGIPLCYHNISGCSI
jgi:hypothetical protein